MEGLAFHPPTVWGLARPISVGEENGSTPFLHASCRATDDVLGLG